ncbi:MAG: NAD(+)/NADH kinase [Clostridia bacterium]|nr:NAD(+)/NADH kinase [Clostridia bacterium]
MKTVLIVKQEDAKATECAANIRQVLHSLSVDILSSEEISCADFVTVVGGDGTIVHAAKKAAAYNLPVLGINAGRVGFLAGLEPEEVHLIEKVINGDYQVDERMLLSVTVQDDQEPIQCYALNEAVVTRNGPARMIDIRLTDGFHGGEMDYRADGLIVATSTGSTAYSLSAGGPVLDPFIEGIIVTPLSPFSLQSRSLVFSPAHPLTVTARCPADDRVIVCVDGEDPIDVTDRAITVQKAEDRVVRLIRIKKDTFFDIYKHKIMERSV